MAKRRTVAGPLYTDRHGITRRGEDCPQPRQSHGWAWPPVHLRCEASGELATVDGACPWCAARLDIAAGDPVPLHIDPTRRRIPD